MVSNRKKKIIASIAAAIAGIGVIVSGTAGDIPGMKDDLSAVQNGNAVVIKGTLNKKEKESSVSKIPLFIRSVFGFIVWALGTLLLKLVDRIIRITMLPVIRFLLMWLFLFLILTAVIILFIKMLFPEWPLKKVITGKLILKTFLGSLFIMTADLAFTLFIDTYAEYRYVAIFVMGIAAICFIMYPYLKMRTEEPLIVYNEIEY